MNSPPGPHEGSNEHLADAGGLSAGGHDGSATPASGAGLRDELLHHADDEPRLAAFLDRSADVLQAGPDELTAHRHLAAMRKEAAAAAAVPARPRILRAASISAAAAVALVVTLAGFGALPAPAQQVLSDVADRVGITIPSPADRVPNGEVPAMQQPAPETTPGRTGGPDRSERPGLTEDGTLRTPGASDGETPPGRADGHSNRGQAPGQGPDVPEAPGEVPEPDPRGRSERQPGQSEQPDPPAPPERSDPPAPTEQSDPPTPPDPADPPDPPAKDPSGSGRGSDESGEKRGQGDQSGDGQSRQGDNPSGTDRR